MTPVRPRLLFLATKDTIAYMTRPAHVASGTELLATVPAGGYDGDVDVEDVLAEPSWDMSPGTMLGLSRRIRAAILEQGYTGVVVAHGTDGLEDTAYLADLVAGLAARRGAIVFTGAVRPLDDPDTDGPANLAAALTAAADPALRGAGTVVCLNGEVHAARWATLVDTTSPAAFSSAPHPPLGRVAGGVVALRAAPPRRPPDPVGDPAADVALIKTFPGIEGVLLSAAVDAGARGVVLEGTGAGNVPVNLFTTISELTGWGVPVLVASRSRTRPVPLDDLDLGAGLAAKVGAIGARGLQAGKARSALMVALGVADATGGGLAAVRDWFDLV
jgi:L-asparaginase